MRTLKGAWGGGGNPAPVLPWYTRLATSQSQNKNLEGGCHSSQHWTDANTGRTKGHLPIFTRVTTKSQTLRRPKLITNLTELVPAVPGWDKLFSYSFQESNKNSKNKIERSIPPPQECGNFTNRKHSPRPSPGAQIVGWFPGERGCPPGFRLFRRGPRETRLQRALRVKLKEKKPPDSPTVAEGAKQWGISAQSGGAQRRLDFPSCLRSSSPEPGMLPQSAYTPPPHMVCRSSEHMNFKMVTRAGGTATGVEGSDSPGTSEKARGPGKEAWVAGVEPWVTRTSGVRREAHRAKVEGEMERGPFKRPSRRSGTGGLSSTPGPACGALPWGEPSPGPLPGGFPHTRSRPALPRGGGSSLPRCLPPPPSSQRPPHLPSYSPLSLLPHPLPAPAPWSAPPSRAPARKALLNGPRPLPSPEEAPGQGPLSSRKPSWKRAEEAESCHFS